MKIDDKCVVSFHYTLTDGEGVELDSSRGQEPLVYLHGAGGIIPGLENALSGKSPGEEFEITVPPAEAYGEVRPEMVQTVPHSAFQEVGGDVQPGMRFQAQGPGGQVQIVTVKSVSDEGVEVDANHPLAGQALHFDIKVEDVREATEDELSHGHAH